MRAMQLTAEGGPESLAPVEGIEALEGIGVTDVIIGFHVHF